MSSFARIGAVAAAALMVAACAFEKRVSNERVREYDPSGIVAGRSTISDVIERIGVPLPDLPEEAGTLLVSRNYLNYRVYEERCFRIGFEELLLITPFRWCYGDHPYELAVEVDVAGMVTGVYETRRDMIWRPFQSEADLAPPQTVELSGSSFR
jgi:hypothetical protein